jgi:hypothetical protein
MDLRQSGPWLIATSSVGEVRIQDKMSRAHDLSGFVDVHVQLHDGRRFTGLFGTLADVKATMGRHRESGETLGGRYFWAAELVLVDRANTETIVAVVEDMARSGELETHLLEYHDEAPPTDHRG